MKRCMRKKVFLCCLALELGMFPLAAQDMWLTGNVTSGTVVYDNPTWFWGYWFDHSITIQGTVTINNNANATAFNPVPYTVDLAPASTMSNGSTPRNSSWQHYTTNGTVETVNLDTVTIYSTNSNPIKMWDAQGVGDNSITINNVEEGQFTKKSTSTSFTFYANIEHNSALAAGLYELPITFRLRKETFPANNGAPKTAPVSTLTVVLRFYVNTAVAIFFTDGNTSAYSGQEISSLNFDEITSMVSKQFTIHVQSNFNFYLSVKSANNGYLRHSTYDQAPVDRRADLQIPYTLTIGGVDANLAGSGYKSAQQSKTTSGSDDMGTASRDFSAVVLINGGNPISYFTAGTYTDSLTFTVSSN